MNLQHLGDVESGHLKHRDGLDPIRLREYITGYVLLQLDAPEEELPHAAAKAVTLECIFKGEYIITVLEHFAALFESVRSCTGACSLCDMLPAKLFASTLGMKIKVWQLGSLDREQNLKRPLQHRCGLLHGMVPPLSSIGARGLGEGGRRHSFKYFSTLSARATTVVLCVQSRHSSPKASFLEEKGRSRVLYE